jgi:transposase InsO family protein
LGVRDVGYARPACRDELAEPSWSTRVRKLPVPTRKDAAGKKPLTLITDDLHAYELAYRREFYAHQKPVTKHVEHVTWKGDKGNQKMEAFNGTVRSREKVMRSLKREDSPILDGYQIFHNHMRPHMGLGGKTPAEVAGIQVKGKNKWLTLIQNASRQETD